MANIPTLILVNNPCFTSLIDCMGQIRDPRIERRKTHQLPKILVLAVCAILSGVNCWTHVAQFARLHEARFAELIDLSDGIPSHDTFSRVMAAVNHEELAIWLNLWLESVVGFNGEHVAMDGKVLKSFRYKDPMVMVRAWDKTNKAVVALERVAVHSNEIATIPDVLRQLNLREKTVTIDAAGTQRENAKIIIDKGGDYILAVKGNQSDLHKNLQLLMDDIIDKQLKHINFSYHQTENQGHGRQETRECWATDYIDWYDRKHLWAGLQTLIAIRATRTVGNQTTITRRYYISSLPPKAARLLSLIRDHWSIENNLHWMLDMVFEEDRSTTRLGFGPQNLAFLRSFCFALLANVSDKLSMKMRRIAAGANNEYLLKTLLNSRI